MPAIRVRGLVKRFESTVAVDGLDLEVREGECFGLLGPNGAGKTTTIEILEGLQAATAGEVEVLGKRWEQNARQIRREIGIQLQETQLYDRFTVEETIRTFRSFYEVKLDVDAVLDLVGLQDKRDAWIKTLSGGQKQRVAVACAVVGDPLLVFLDEPTTGLDPAARRSLWEIVFGLKRRGRTVLLTTHYMEEAERLCDRIAIVNKGKVIALGTPRELVSSLGAETIVEVELDQRLEQSALSNLPGVLAAREEHAHVRIETSEVHRVVPALIAGLERDGVKLMGLRTRHATLDDVFLKLTGSTFAEAEAQPRATETTD